MWRSDTPISDSGRLPITFSPKRKFRRATVRRPAFCVMSLLRSSSTACVIPSTFAPLPGPHSGAAVIAAFLLGTSNQGSEVMRQHECRRIDRLPWFSFSKSNPLALGFDLVLVTRSWQSVGGKYLHHWLFNFQGAEETNGSVKFSLTEPLLRC